MDMDLDFTFLSQESRLTLEMGIVCYRQQREIAAHFDSGGLWLSTISILEALSEAAIIAESEFFYKKWWMRKLNKDKNADALKQLRFFITQEMQLVARKLAQRIALSIRDGDYTDKRFNREKLKKAVLMIKYYGEPSLKEQCRLLCDSGIALAIKTRRPRWIFRYHNKLATYFNITLPVNTVFYAMIEPVEKAATLDISLLIESGQWELLCEAGRVLANEQKQLEELILRGWRAWFFKNSNAALKIRQQQLHDLKIRIIEKQTAIFKKCLQYPPSQHLHRQSALSVTAHQEMMGFLEISEKIAVAEENNPLLQAVQFSRERFRAFLEHESFFRCVEDRRNTVTKALICLSQKNSVPTADFEKAVQDYRRLAAADRALVANDNKAVLQALKQSLWRFLKPTQLQVENDNLVLLQQTAEFIQLGLMGDAVNVELSQKLYSFLAHYESSLADLGAQYDDAKLNQFDKFLEQIIEKVPEAIMQGRLAASLRSISHRRCVKKDFCMPEGVSTLLAQSTEISASIRGLGAKLQQLSQDEQTGSIKNDECIGTVDKHRLTIQCA